MRHEGLMAGVLPGLSARHRVSSHRLLEELLGPSFIHTRVDEPAGCAADRSRDDHPRAIGGDR